MIIANKKKTLNKQRRQQDAYMDVLLENFKREEATIDQIIAKKTALLRTAIHDKIIYFLLQEVQSISCNNTNTLSEESPNIQISENTYQSNENICNTFSQIETTAVCNSEDKSEVLIEESVAKSIEQTQDLPHPSLDITDSLPTKLKDFFDKEPEEVVDESLIINVTDILTVNATQFKDNQLIQEDSQPQMNAFDSIIDEIKKKNEAKEQARIITEQADTIRKQNMEVLNRKIQQELTLEKEPIKKTIQHEEALNKELEKRKKEALKIAERDRAKQNKNK